MSKEAVRQLRALADRIEAGELCVTSLSAKAFLRRLPPQPGDAFVRREFTGRAAVLLTYQRAQATHQDGVRLAPGDPDPGDGELA